MTFVVHPEQAARRARRTARQRQVGEKVVVGAELRLLLGADPLSLSIAEFDAMIQRELKENAELIKKAGIKAN